MTTYKFHLRSFLLVGSIFVFSTAARAQKTPYNYDAQWKIVDSLVDKKGLPASALSQVNNIYTRARQDNNGPQQLKALIYRLRLQETREEDADLRSIQSLDSAIVASRQPARSILQNIQAGLYWNYFQSNRYKIYNRTSVSAQTSKDPSTWTIRDFHKKIGELYLASIREEQLLQNTALQNFNPILDKGNARWLRPTLFDLLAHRALNYFSTDERDLERPADAFEINDPIAFSPAASFAEHAFKTTDTISLKLTALKLYQRLIRFHRQDARPDALIDLDIYRIKFVYQHSTSEKKDSLYISALTTLTDKYSKNPIAATASYLIAEYYVNTAGRFKPYEDTTHRYDYIKAKAICDKVIAQSDSSEGKWRCMNLLHSILQQTLSFKTEKVNLPGQPFRSQLTWRNFNTLYLRIIRLDATSQQSLGENSYQEGWWKRLLQLPVVRNFSQQLPVTGDYQPHSLEFKTDALPVGVYAMVASTSPDFDLSNNQLAAQYLYISAISFINSGFDYFVVDRQSGRPLPGVSVQTWDRIYKNNKQTLVKSLSYTSDAHGHFQIAQPDKKNTPYDRLLEFSSAADHLFIQDEFTMYRSFSRDRDQIDRLKFERDNRASYLFTDRGIYRPGQTVYYKGIVITRDADSRLPKLLSNFTTRVALYDVNGMAVDSITVTTNEYGSYHGKFTLPSNRLNGQYSIRDDSTESNRYFSVEEYKRPRFFVEYEKLKNSYRVGDSILVKGNAMAYAGNAIVEASVKYRVIRQTRIPIWYGGWRNPRSMQGQEIAHGEISTDAFGKFQIRFLAIPDASLSADSDPVFEYKITADITDINGETRSGETTIAAGYKTIELIIPTPSIQPADSLKTIRILATNLSGQPLATTVHVNIYPLQSPSRLIRERYWERPDQFVIGKEEYIRLFPHDEYDNETDKTNWAKGNPLMDLTDSTGHALPVKSLQPGWYLIEAHAKDKFGREAKTLQYIQLYAPGVPAAPAYLWATGDPENKTFQPGQKATHYVGSSASDIFLFRRTARLEKPEEYSYFDDGLKRPEIPITTNDRGGFSISDALVKDNRIYTLTHSIAVPWVDKELSVDYLTWRDKTLPGSEEKWKVHISGYGSEKANAEVLSAMYDASLDQFQPQQWQKPAVYPEFSETGGWTRNTGFMAPEAWIKNREEQYHEPYVYSYDDLIDAQLRNSSFGSGRIRYMAKSASGETFVQAERMNAAPGAAPMIVQVPDMVRDPDGSKGIMKDEIASTSNEASAANPAPTPPSGQPRRNFNETAFFFPDLHTDSAGDLTLSFTMPEALTQWKMMTLAHTKDLAFGYSEKTVVTQKQLMVQPNLPRFLREGDRLELSVKVVNLTDSEMTGQMQLQLTDPTNGKTADGMFTNRQPNQYFTIAAGQSAVVNFPVDVPFQYNRPLTYRIQAQARNYTDGEEATIPVISNRMLVTESLPLNMSGNGTKSFKFDKLLNSGNSETLNNHALTVEFTSNPVWYAVQSLPYLTEYPHECAEQSFNRFYANALASTIAGNSPKLRAIVDKWKDLDTAALLSNLEKNQELKSVLLQETPWVLQGKSESRQKKNIALLFDMTRMSRDLENALSKLADMQSDAGGFVWFKGGSDDRYITQYIVTGIGHLQKLHAIPAAFQSRLSAIVARALPWLDQQAKKDYDNILKLQKTAPAKSTAGSRIAGPKMPPIGDLDVQYIYTRSFFDQDIPGNILPAISYFRKQAQQTWAQQNKFMQGMIALALYRTGDAQTSKDILRSLRETAIRDEEKGMYWKGMEGGYYWYQSPIETQALLIEAFHTVSPDAAVERDCKTWLLRQKQTHSWPTTRATADACYALLLDAPDLLSAERDVTVRLGDKTASATSADAQAGTGYFKKVFDGPFVNPSMGNISVTLANTSGTASSNSGSLPAWGAVYWQYFDNLDRITAAANGKAPLQLTKKLFVQRNTDRGPVLDPLAENATLHVGDKVTVRIELRSDRDLEYVHMKDMRASCMEPVNVISEYKWQGGLGYYETTKDAGTDFFFSHISRGTYVFEYTLFVGQTGNFSNGVTSIECMYAPEFSFHSEGIRVNVEQREPS